MALFEGSFLLLDRLARTTEGLSLKRDDFDDLVVGHDDTAYVGSPNLTESADFYTGNPQVEAVGFSATGAQYEGTPRIIDVVGIGSSGAYSCPASALAQAGDIDILFIYGAFTGTIAALPSGYSDMGGAAQSSLSSGRWCYRVLAGASTATSLADLGEANGAVRFIVRGANPSALNYHLDVGLFNSMTSVNNSDQDIPRLYLMAIFAYSLSQYADALVGPVGSSPYVYRNWGGGYGMATIYSTYSGEYLGSTFPVGTHTSDYEYTSYGSISLRAPAAPSKPQVLVVSEAPDVVAFSVETTISSRTASMAVSEEPDIVAAQLVIPKEASVSIDIELASLFTCEGGRLIGGPAIFDQASGVSASFIKNTISDASILLNSQAVPNVRKNTNSSISFGFSLGYDFEYSVYIDLGVGQEAFIEAISSLLSTGIKRSHSVAGISAVSDLSGGGFKNSRISSSVICGHDLSMDSLKGGLGAAFLFFTDDIEAGFSGGHGCSIALDLNAMPAAMCSKAAYSFALLNLTHALGALVRIVTTFEYGDIVVTDLRATKGGMEQTCLRKAIVIEVRRGEGLELSCLRGEPDQAVRRRILDLLGTGPRISGKEIVCVREVFDESK